MFLPFLSVPILVVRLGDIVVVIVTIAVAFNPLSTSSCVSTTMYDLCNKAISLRKEVKDLYPSWMCDAYLCRGGGLQPQPPNPTT